MTNRILMSGLLVLVTSTASGQATGVPSAQATAFMGTWSFTMTEPPDFKGSTQTIRIRESNEMVAASFQSQIGPEIEVTGIVKDGDMLVLTISNRAKMTVRENGAPIWVVISLVRDGETMKVAQMFERSQTIKRGIGQKQ